MNKLEFKYKDTALIDERQITDTAKSLKEYIAYLEDVARRNDYSFFESSINLPFDSKLLSKVKDIISRKNTGKLKYVIVIGIGGSNLGTIAIYEALYGKLDGFLKTRLPKLLFADTVSARLLKDIKEILETNVQNPEEILVNVISKSGTTTETIAHFESIFDLLKRRFENVSERFVITTDYQSKLWTEGEKQGFALLDIPQKVGGRYSVFSAVGLFPLILAGIDVNNLLKGAADMREICLHEDLKHNLALVSAILLYLHHKNGITISNNFFFNPELESVGKWYRQLMGESIGKEKDIKNNVVHTGITPTIAIGSTDLHSLSQLYLGGPRDKFTTFVYASDKDVGVRVPKEAVLSGLVEGIAGKSFSQLMEAIFEGVKIAYQKNKLPFVEILLPKVSEYTLGQYLQFKMMEMMYLGKLMNVNAFDQPNVESYKVETRRILNR